MSRGPHTQPGFIAALLHRLSGIALAIFVPFHFLALATALNTSFFAERVALAIISSTAARALARTSSSTMPPMGCGMTTMARPGTPVVRATLFASWVNWVVATVTVGVPSFSIRLVSWIHHDVQLPQSALVPMTRSALSAM